MLLSYIRFFFKSIHLHGIHSPFVFSLITRGLRSKKISILYPKNSELSQKEWQFFIKLIRYANAQMIFIDDEKLKNQANEIEKERFFSSEIKQEKYDIIFLQKAYLQENIISFLDLMNNDSVLIINNLQKKSNQQKWNELITDIRCTACVTTFFQGLIFIRKEQKKQVFCVRI